MRRLTILLLLITLPVMLITAQSFTQSFSSRTGGTEATGSWNVQGGRLFQQDLEESIATIHFRVPQSGKMQYEFNVRYEKGGIEDRMGGFGMHVFADSMHNGRAWGVDGSYLLWINYDENATYGMPGFRAQVYKSTSHSTMHIMEKYDVGLPVSVLKAENADVKVPAQIIVDGDSGEVKVYDPTVSNYYYVFYLDNAPGRGNYFSLRTNSLSVSFDDLKVTKID